MYAKNIRLSYHITHWENENTSSVTLHLAIQGEFFYLKALKYLKKYASYEKIVYNKNYLFYYDLELFLGCIAALIVTKILPTDKTLNLS